MVTPPRQDDAKTESARQRSTIQCSCQKVDNRAFVVTSVQFSAQSHKSV